ncbi:MAG: septum site-determining protein MinC, partial [Ruminiclostridium sp.]
MDENAVMFKGTVNGLTIILKQDVTFDEIVSSMHSKVSNAGKFFRGAKLAVKYKGRVLSEEEKSKLFDLLNKESGAQILSFDEEVVETI